MSYDTKTELRIARSDVARAYEIFFDDMEDTIECEDKPDGTALAHMHELEFAQSDEEDLLAAEGIPFVLFHRGPKGFGKAAFDGTKRVEVVTGEAGDVWLRVEPHTGEPHPDMAAAARRYFAMERRAIDAMRARDELARKMGDRERSG